jgi:hypothetical protein
MNGVQFRDLPRRIDRRLYDEAAACYARCVAPRVRGLYQVGNVSYPGLSDIDMVAVVDQARWDNNQFFSPFLRLPEAYRNLFHHGPRVVPMTCLDAVKFGSTGHQPVSDDAAPATGAGSRRRLLVGTDALGPRTASLSPPWLACRVLEAAYLFRLALDELHAAPSVSAARMVSRAVALRYPMRHLAVLMAVDYDGEYDRALDQCRAALLEDDMSMRARSQTALEAFDLFSSALTRFESGVRSYFELPAGADVGLAAKEMLSGRMPINGADPSFIAARHDCMRSYHDALRAYGFSHGSIFATSPYDGRYAAYRQPLLLRVAAGAAYRVHKFIARPSWRSVAAPT